MPARFEVRTYVLSGTRPSVESCATEDAVREAFAREYGKLAEGAAPRLFRVTLIVDGVLAEVQYVVTRPSTYNPPPNRS